jgi:hypothetical protein
MVFAPPRDPDRTPYHDALEKWNTRIGPDPHRALHAGIPTSCLSTSARRGRSWPWEEWPESTEVLEETGAGVPCFEHVISKRSPSGGACTSDIWFELSLESSIWIAATRHRLLMASVLEFRLTRVFALDPRCYHFRTATRGCFVRFIPPKLVNQVLLFILLLDVFFALTGTAAAQCPSPPAGGWSQSNRPPTTCVPYPNSLWSKQLPNAGSGGPMNHLAANSDAIAQNTLGAGLTNVSTAGTGAIVMNPFYYGRASDPIYVLNSCSRPGSDPAHNPLGTFWHIPNRALVAGGASDEFFSVWDQTTNKVLSWYHNAGTPPYQLPNCTATTTATACPISPTVPVSYCNMADYSTDKGYQAGNGAGDSLANAPAALVLKADEWVNNQIHHALYLNTSCQTAQTVFPAGNHAAFCSTFGVSDTNQAPVGALYFFDYTDAQIAAMSIPAWQKNLIIAMSHYGGYIGDTNSNQHQGVYVARYEAQEAFVTAGVTNPLYSWLDGQGLTHHTDSTSQNYTISLWSGVPNVVGPNCPNSTCGIALHAHIADSCVALGLAGQPGGCASPVSLSATEPSAPTGLKATVN